jgi:hypothetical protein
MISLLVSALIWLLVFGLIFYVIYWVTGLLTLPDPMRKIVLAILGVIGLIVLLEHFLPLLTGMSAR